MPHRTFWANADSKRRFIYVASELAKGHRLPHEQAQWLLDQTKRLLKEKAQLRAERDAALAKLDDQGWEV